MHVKSFLKEELELDKTAETLQCLGVMVLKLHLVVTRHQDNDEYNAVQYQCTANQGLFLTQKIEVEKLGLP